MIVTFRLKGPMNNRLGSVGKTQPGETGIIRSEDILMLFPDHKQIMLRGTKGLTYDVFPDDWQKVVDTFYGESTR